MAYALPRPVDGSGPLEMPELLAAGLSVEEAGMLAWDVPEEAFAAFLQKREI